MATNFRQVKTTANGDKYIDDYFVYTATFSAIAPGTIQTQNINIEADSDFIAERISQYTVLDYGSTTGETHATRFNSYLKVSIKDSGSGRDLQDEPVFLQSISGNGQLPFVLPVPRWFKANSTINIRVENEGTADTYAECQIAFIGIKRFYL